MSDSFLDIFDAPMQGILTWDKFDALWQVLAGSGGDWFVYDLAGDVPQAPIADINPALKVVTSLLGPARKNSYCGAVYVDNIQTPGFVKVFDPNKMGSACGCSGERILPRFVFSRVAPVRLVAKDVVEKPGVLARMFGR